MDLYIMRHGNAVNVGKAGVQRDADRMLSEKGRERTAEVATGLGKLDCRPAHIASSPLVRARETAEIVRDHLVPGQQIDTIEEFACGSDLKAVLRWLRTCEGESVLLVGHMPDVNELAALCMARDASPSLVFRTAAVCSLTFHQTVARGTAVLNWHLQPSALRRLA